MFKDGNPTGLDVLKADVETRLGRDFPSLCIDKLMLIDNKSTRLVIDDISYRADVSIDEALEFLFLSCQGDVQAFDVKDLVQGLATRMETLLRVVNQRKTVVFFPGNGAETIRKLLPEDIFGNATIVSLPAERRINTKTKAVEGVTILNVTQARKVLSGITVESIIVVDDAIVTGSTLTVLRNTFPYRKVKWYAASLFMLSPLQNRGQAQKPSGIEGYDSIIAPVVYQGMSGIPPLNSLSTLVGTSEKSRRVRDRYVADFVADQAIFMETIKQLQQSFTL